MSGKSSAGWWVWGDLVVYFFNLLGACGCKGHWAECGA
jgi:hypothetical protein